MVIPGKMQAALVSYYDEKPPLLRELIRYSQDKLASLLLSSFRPYEMAQVHGTIVGLEGYRLGDGIVNAHYRSLRGEDKTVAPRELLEFLRSDQLPSFNVRIGGFRHHVDYGFFSQNRHPYLRSFSIQNDIAVAMGWPYDGVDYPMVLDRLRRQFNNYNVLHRWHRQLGSIDNDYYFVLGRVNRKLLTDVQVQGVEEEMRRFLAGLTGLTLPIDHSVLSIVGYLDTQLPVQTSCSYRINGNELDEFKLLELYPDDRDSR